MPPKAFLYESKSVYRVAQVFGVVCRTYQAYLSDPLLEYML